ncbi:hypothetical protein Tco_0017951, partial [Tanacetum coccineum]
MDPTRRVPSSGSTPLEESTLDLEKTCYSQFRQGVLTDIPAILVFVSRKVHKQWLTPIQCLPTILEGPGSVWCDVDVIEFSYFGAPELASKEQLYTEIVDDLHYPNQKMFHPTQEVKEAIFSMGND